MSARFSPNAIFVRLFVLLWLRPLTRTVGFAACVRRAMRSVCEPTDLAELTCQGLCSDAMPSENVNPALAVG